MLVAQSIYLRKLQPKDGKAMFSWENNPENWNVSETVKPFSKEEIEIFVSTDQDLNTNKQFRYVVCLNETKQPIGTLDLFEFDAYKKKVGIGILIAEKKHRNKGYASEMLNLINDFCRNELKLVTLFCNIQKENIVSIRLFEKCGFHFVEKRILFEKEVNYYELKL